MKLKIKIKRFRNIEGKPLVSLPKVIKKGDWVDLCAAQEMVLNAPQAGTLKGHDVKHRDVVSEVTYIPLGVAMQLPAGFEAVMVSRSSAPKKLGVMMANNFAVIDNSYSGNNDQWMLPVVTLRKTSIAQNTRICQFRIQLSQKATFWQKVRWFLSSGIALTEVESLDNDSRMGLGEGTGYNKL